MIRIRDIDHLVLRVVDVDAMLDFYCGVLGMREERRLDELGLIQLRAGRSLIDLVPVAIRHKSTEPGVGCAAFGSNSRPARCRLIFWRPKASALRPAANVTTRMPSTRV